MSGFNDQFSRFCDRGGGDHSRDWQELFFPGARSPINSSGMRWVPGGPLGNSRLASTQDLLALKEAGARDRRNYMQLLSAYAIAHDPQPSIVDVGPLVLPMGDTSPNVLGVGRSGCGKTQKLTLPAALHAFRCGWSILYINAKGKKQTRFIRELAELAGRGSEVKLLAPLKPERSLACSCLDGCQNLTKANELAECLVATAARTSRDGDGAWCYNQAQQFLQHAIAAICTDLPPARRNLIELRRVISSGDYKAFADAHRAFPVLANFASFVGRDNRNGDTVASAISECTAFVDELAPFLSKDEWKCEAFATDGGCVIVEIDPPDVDRMRPITTLLLGKMIASLERAASDSPYGCIPHKSVVIIDELIASGAIPRLSATLHTCREMGFCFVAGVQSFSQIGNIYGHQAQSVLDGFQTQVAFGGGLDLMTAECFSYRSGVGTIALPGVHGPEGEDGDLAFSGNWQLTSRPILLPSDIASPQHHSDCGAPVTIFVGDGKTPPFQAYLTPCYEEGGLARVMEEVAGRAEDKDRRESALSTAELKWEPPASGPSGITHTRGWSNEQISEKVEQLRLALDWDGASEAVRLWWSRLEQSHSDDMRLVLRLMEELRSRRATLIDFFDAYLESGCETVGSNLHYLDYMLSRRSEKKMSGQQIETPQGGATQGDARKSQPEPRAACQPTAAQSEASTAEGTPAVDTDAIPLEILDDMAEYEPYASDWEVMDAMGILETLDDFNREEFQWGAGEGEAGHEDRGEAEADSEDRYFLFVRCSHCRSLTPAHREKCQICGSDLA